MKIADTELEIHIGDITRLEVDEIAQHQKRGGRVDRQHRQLHRIDAGGQRHQRSGWQLQQRRPAATADRQQDHRSDRERIHIIGYRHDTTHTLIAANGRQRRQNAVLTGDGQHIAGVDRRGEHFDASLASPQLRQFKLNRSDQLLRIGATLGVLGSDGLHLGAPGK